MRKLRLSRRTIAIAAALLCTAVALLCRFAPAGGYVIGVVHANRYVFRVFRIEGQPTFPIPGILRVPNGSRTFASVSYCFDCAHQSVHSFGCDRPQSPETVTDLQWYTSYRVLRSLGPIELAEVFGGRVDWDYTVSAPEWLTMGTGTLATLLALLAFQELRRRLRHRHRLAHG